MSTREEKLKEFRDSQGINNDDLTIEEDNIILLCGIPLNEWHRRMWKWIEAHGKSGATKRMFVEANFEDSSTIRQTLFLYGDCFACLYDGIFNDEGTGCELCPIGSFNEERGCLEGLFFDYVNAPKEKEHKLAKRIAELDWEWK